MLSLCKVHSAMVSDHHLQIGRSVTFTGEQPGLEMINDLVEGEKADMTRTEMWSQLRKVRSFAKKVFGSTRVRTSALDLQDFSAGLIINLKILLVFLLGLQIFSSVRLASSQFSGHLPPLKGS